MRCVASWASQIPPLAESRRRPRDSCTLQPCPLPESFHEIVGAEALNRNVHMEGYPLTGFIVGVNKIAGAQVSAPVQ